MKIKAKYLVLVALGAGLLSSGKIIPNTFNSLFQQGFFIPEESSFRAFSVIKWNEGSGEWWLHGEDRRNYYTILFESSSESGDYAVIPKTDGRGIDLDDQSTWGEDWFVSRRTGE